MSSNPAPPSPLGLEDPPTGSREDTPTASRLIDPLLGEEKDLSPLAVVAPKKGSLASAAWLSDEGASNAKKKRDGTKTPCV